MEKNTRETGNKANLFMTFLGNIAAVSGGITILFGCFGFLALKAHGNLLGIGAVEKFAVEDFVHEGSLFFIRTVTLGLIYSITNVYIVLLMILLVISHIVSEANVKIKRKIQALRQFIREQQFAYLLTCVFLLLAGIVYIGNTVGGDGLLFMEITDGHVIARSTEEGLELLKEQYALDLVIFIVSSIIVVPQLKTLFAQKNFTSVTVPSYIALSLYLIGCMLLPISYGKKILANDFQKVAVVSFKKDATDTIQQDSCLWLVQDQPSQFILYSSNRKQLHVVSKTNVVNLSIGKSDNIFHNILYQNK